MRPRRPEWTAVIVDQDAGSRQRLRATVVEAGGAVVAEADGVHALAAAATACDVIVGEPMRRARRWRACAP